MQGGETEGYEPSEEEQRTEPIESTTQPDKPEEKQEKPEKLPGFSAKFKISTPKGDVVLEVGDIRVVSGKEILQQDPHLDSQPNQVEFQGLTEKPKEEPPSPESQEHANELRRRYQEMNMSRYLELPLDQIPDLPKAAVERAKEEEGINSVDDFINQYESHQYQRGTLFAGQPELFFKKYTELGLSLKQFLGQVEQTAVDQLGLLGEENRILTHENFLNLDLIRHLGNYRHDTRGQYKNPEPEDYQLASLRSIQRNFRRNLPTPREIGTLAIWTKEEIQSTRVDRSPIRARKLENLLKTAGLTHASG